METLGLVAATVMPFWNIPLIMRIWKRKSSDDISVPWVIGVWLSILALLPSSLVSPDLAMRIFGSVNAVLFSGVVIVTIKFHKKNQN